MSIKNGYVVYLMPYSGPQRFDGKEFRSLPFNECNGATVFLRRKAAKDAINKDVANKSWMFPEVRRKAFVIFKVNIRV